MFCAQCGADVGRDDRQCASCQAELWKPGAVRLTSPREPAQQLGDIFPEMVTPSSDAVPAASGAVARRLGSQTMVLAAIGVVVLVALLIWLL